jgi:hypothetical protein
MEKYIIPTHADQPTNAFYNPAKPATYAPSTRCPAEYPSQLDTGVSVGTDPIAGELKSAYGTTDIYGMHWLLDVDNVYGYGHCGDGTDAGSPTSTPSSAARRSRCGRPCRSRPATRSSTAAPTATSTCSPRTRYAKQWKYTNAPDADARAVQAAYWALQWATAQGKQRAISATVAKAAKMGDYLRYAMYDKYFKKIGNCVGPSTCPAGTGKNSSSTTCCPGTTPGAARPTRRRLGLADRLQRHTTSATRTRWPRTRCPT